VKKRVKVQPKGLDQNSSKKYHIRDIDVNYRYHGKGKYIQPKKCSIKENLPQFWSEYANAVFVAQTGELLEYRHLMQIMSKEREIMGVSLRNNEPC